MKKYLIYGLAFSMLLVLFSLSSCRGTIRSRTHNPGDRSITIVKRPKRQKIKGRKKVVVTRKYNRVRKH